MFEKVSNLGKLNLPARYTTPAYIYGSVIRNRPGDNIIYSSTILEQVFANSPTQAREFANRVHSRLKTENGFSMAKVAWVKDAKTGRFC